MCLKVEQELICEIVPVSSEDLVFSVDIPLFKITDHARLEIKKNSKSPFGDYQRKNGRQMQKCSRQIVQEQKLRVEPHLIDIVVRLLELNMLQKHPPVAAA